MAIQVEVPRLGESVTQALLVKWHKKDGERVAVDEPLCELETDKANVDVPAPGAGIIRHVKEEGQTVGIGEVVARIDDGGKPAPASAPAPAQPKVTAPAATSNDVLSPAVKKMVDENEIDPSQIRGTGPGGRLTKEDVQQFIERNRAAVASTPTAPSPISPAPKKSEYPASVTANRPAAAEGKIDFGSDGIRRVPMSKIRKRIAENLVKAQQTAAILTTFNEIDMQAVMDLRAKYKERFQEVHGIGLGFMSFFARATALALKEFPRVNAAIEGDDIVYHNFVHLGIAVSTERGLAVPVMRNVHEMSFARIENEIKRLANAVRDGKLGLEELSGGTFTITNGGVFGSMMSTPIINPPQAAILGMHAIIKRPVAIGDKIEIRPMMYVALSYDHRLVDGRESVSFLVRVKQLIEDPARLMLEI
ncbi:MAG TPA: 2-oxoglutarate dehydrogenase complex dihydrolipoyllysine-residue succinyltransferase [Tepidisphaeraceae bacterium]|nr:2-oxoglutarate dehydrogenase complex dihydrolipoyllysine-residue succinyltransferase [Tepidisphaeraceae bacterium]